MNQMNLLLSLILITNYYFMDYKKFENLLGKHISVATEVIGNDFENKLFGNNFYYTDNFINKDFYNMSYNSLTILIDEEDIIQSITVHISEVVNREFYNPFTVNYGYPDTMHIAESKKVISEDNLYSKSLSQNLKKVKVELREGKFDENPLFIVWKKEDYEIKILIRKEQNTSDITFSKHKKV